MGPGFWDPPDKLWDSCGHRFKEAKVVLWVRQSHVIWEFASGHPWPAQGVLDPLSSCYSPYYSCLHSLISQD